MSFNLEKEALIASGLTREASIRPYLFKLDYIIRRSISEDNKDFSILTRSKNLFESLWKDKPHRYRQQGHFRFDEVIDAQLSEKNQAVGNCLGLTLLYNCLLKRIGIHAKVLYLENAFNIGPHVLTVLRFNNAIIDVENSLPNGFDYGGHKQNPLRLEWGDTDLVADIYQSAGTELFEDGQFNEALENYEKSLIFNPVYERAKLNKAILVERMNQEK
jgi:tetratricopeptide (TPR) repeat protein